MTSAASHRDCATTGREDISRFAVHLTRDDRGDFDGGQTATKNFRSILQEKKIRAIDAHCLHRKKLASLPTGVQRRFKVVCFTEVPLNQIHLLTRRITGRQVNLEPYGFVFRREFLIEQGAQPAIYVNSYGGEHTVRDAVDKIFEISDKNRFRGKTWRILPFVNAMHERYDFTWEREWRVTGTVSFTLTDLVCCILPENRDADLKARLARSGIAVISPGWTYEQIVAELARQQRTTKRLILKAKIVGARKAGVGR